MKRKIIALVMAGILVFSLQGCSTSEQADTKAESNSDAAEGAGSEIQAADGDDIVIKVACRYGSDVPDEVNFREKMQEFSDLDNGISVVVDAITTEDDYLDNLRTSFASGDTANVFIEYGGSRTLDYLEADALLNMQPYFDADPDWYNSFNPAVWDKLIYDGYEGVWGVPFKMYTVCLYYNKEIFEEYNLEAPETFDELLDCCEVLKEAGINPFQTGESENWRLGHFSNNLIIKSLGTECVEKLADRSLAYDSEDMIAVFKIIEEMNEKGYLGEDILSTDATTEKAVFADGGSAMRWDGSWYVGEIFGEEIYDKVGVVPFPYINEEYKNEAQGSASDLWFVSTLNKSEEEIEASVELLEYMTSPEYYAAGFEASSQLYPVEFEKTETTPENPLMDEVIDIANSMTAMKDDIQTYDNASHMLDTVRNAIQGIAMGNTAEECAQQIMERIAEED